MGSEPRSIAKATMRVAERTGRCLSAPWRALPDFIIIGAQRSGTSSLHAYLEADHRFEHAAMKEVHWFDRHHDEPLRRYRSNFPLRSELRRSGKLTGEASPWYLLHPLVPDRLAETLPDVRLIALLRNPRERAWAQFRMQRKRGRETLPFANAIAAEDDRLAADRAHLSGGLDPGLNYINYSYVTRGFYADQLERWSQFLDAGKLLLIDADVFFAATELIYRQVVGFLGLDPDAPVPALPTPKLPARPPMPDEAAHILDERFREPNARLAERFGIDFTIPLDERVAQVRHQDA